MKKINFPTLPKPAVACALALTLACAVGLCACSQQNAGRTSDAGSSTQPSGLVKSADYPNEVTAGALSLNYPDGFSVAKEYGAGQNAGNLPDGVGDTASALLLNESGSVMISVVGAEDSGKIGIDGLSSWIADAPERLEKMKDSQPEMYESLKNIVREDPEKTTVNGFEALHAATKSGAIATETYYLAKNGAIAGYVSIAAPESDWNENRETYESIIATTNVK